MSPVSSSLRHRLRLERPGRLVAVRPTTAYTESCGRGCRRLLGLAEPLPYQIAELKLPLNRYDLSGPDPRSSESQTPAAGKQVERNRVWPDQQSGQPLRDPVRLRRRMAAGRARPAWCSREKNLDARSLPRRYSWRPPASTVKAGHPSTHTSSSHPTSCSNTKFVAMRPPA